MVAIGQVTLAPERGLMTSVAGVPAHPLLVHVVVVLIPLTAVLLVLIALSPAVRQRFAMLTAALSALALISVPVTTSAGEWLEHHVARTALVRGHSHLGDTMLPWGIALFALAAVIAAREKLRSRGRAIAVARSDKSTSVADDSTAHGFGGVVATAGLAVLAVVVAIGSVVTVYRIGESGARAAWTGHFNAQANPPSPHRQTNR